ncbi:MAG: hypothetical protein QXZ09_04010 [Candidatus Methanomethylicaceae archaeon]
MPTMSLIEIVQDIHAMDEELRHYEARYGLRSEYFYELYRAGRLSDEDPLEARDYSDWAACYEIKRHREELYDALIRDALQKAREEGPLSLAELKLTLVSSSLLV